MQGPPMMGGPGGPGDMLMQINKENFPLFIIQNQELVEEEDQVAFKKHALGIVRNGLISSTLGIFLNVKNIPKINFMKWNRFVRIGARLPLFALPFGLFYKDFDHKFTELEFMRRKYFSRILRYQKTGDMKYLDPSGRLQSKFEQRMG